MEGSYDMKYIEILDWILDNDDKRIVDEEKYRLNIEFVHSLGLKCDCVGWSSLNLSDPRADEILSAIDTFCKKNEWKARGIYTRTYAEYTSDWYEIVPTTFKDNMELKVPRSEFGLLVEGDEGVLSFQGTRYLGFERKY